MSSASQHQVAIASDPVTRTPPPAPVTALTPVSGVPETLQDGMPLPDRDVVLRRTVVSPDGVYCYVSDELNHRVQIVDSAGTTRDVGGVGSGAGQFQFPRGLALLSTGTPSTSRLYVCDAWNHRIQVFDGRGTVVGAFGGRGAGPGQLDVPSDVVFVWPRFGGEGHDDDDPDELMLAVADSWNGRVQLFDLTGAFVAVVGSARDTVELEGDVPPSARQGWPFVRTGPQPVLTFPTRLTWRSPHLEVHCAGGVVRRVDLAYAMLPHFSTWRAGCPEPALDAAHTYFRGRSGGAELPAEALAQIETDLGVALLARGDLAGAGVLWAEAWPTGLDGSAMERQLEQRCERMLPMVGRRGGSQLVRAMVSRVAQLRRVCPSTTTAKDASRARALGSPLPRTTNGGNGADRLGRLLTVVAERAGARSSAVDVVWSAPDGERSLGPLAVSGEEVALVSTRARALWVFDRALTPLRRLSLDRSLGPSCLTAHPRGGWLVEDEGWGRLIRIDGAQHHVERTRIGDTARSPVPVAMTASQDRLYVAEFDRDRVVVRDLSGRVLGGYRDIAGPLSLALDGQCLWVATSRPAGLRCLDLNTGHYRVKVQHQELISPVQIAPVGNGTLLVADASAGCVHGFTTTGEWLGCLNEVAGVPLGRPSGVAVLDADSGVVADQQYGRLIRFELPTLETGWWRL